jgi:hypothetical protein
LKPVARGARSSARNRGRTFPPGAANGHSGKGWSRGPLDRRGEELGWSLDAPEGSGARTRASRGKGRSRGLRRRERPAMRRPATMPETAPESRLCAGKGPSAAARGRAERARSGRTLPSRCHVHHWQRAGRPFCQHLRNIARCGQPVDGQLPAGAGPMPSPRRPCWGEPRSQQQSRQTARRENSRLARPFGTSKRLISCA